MTSDLIPACAHMRRRVAALSLLVVLACSAVLAPPVDAQAGVGVIGRPSWPLPHATGAAEVEPELLRGLRSGQSRDFVVEFRERADLSGARGMDWRARGRHVHERLRSTAERSQAGVRAELARRGIASEPFWIKNVLLVRDGDLAAMSAIAASDQVLRIRSLPRVDRIEPRPALATTPSRGDGIAPNIVQVGADRAWAQGTTGRGITVGILDGGVMYGHESIVRQYRGNLGNGTFEHDYNWLGAHDEPYEGDNAHATHVTATVVGDNHATDPAARKRVGMAPDANWIACDIFALEGDPTGEWILRCGEFMLAPTRRDGSAPDPDRRPQVVNNSWSERDCDGTASPFYADIVEAWVAAGIFPAFAAGNSFSCGFPEPPGLSTLSSPASLASAFAIGSSGNHDGAYAPHSLWGPTDAVSPGLPDYPDPRGYPQLKPQVIAPGVAIESAMIEGPQDYGAMTGTSMSTPHVSGLVALMLEAGSCLVGDYPALGGIIMQTARPIDYASGGTPSPGPGNVPNYATGWGEIDAAAAVDAAADACGPSGFVAGTVRGADGAPIAGARIEFLPAGAAADATSATDGRYVRRVPATGAVLGVRVTAYGYLAYVENGVQVRPGQTTPLDVVLALAPTHKLGGIVRDAQTGWPLHARITVAGSPLAPLWSDPQSGAWSVRLPAGGQYRLDVAPGIDGYRGTSIELGDFDGGRNEDIALEADAVACNAPGYAHAGTVYAQDFEAGGLPPGWNRSSLGLGWQFGDSDALSSPGFAIPAHGGFAAANDELGADGGWANDARFDLLVMPPVDLSMLDRPVLSYRSFLTQESPPWDGREVARVEASVDGGATWLRLGAPSATTHDAGWTTQAVDLSPVAAPSVLIRFHADDFGGDDWGALGAGWAIDDVAVRMSCSAPAGGALVVGQVRDANTGLPLDGARVRIDDGASVTTRASEDPGVGAGFYALHAPASASSVMATPGAPLPAGYGDAQSAVSGATSTTLRRDLALPAGRLRLHPATPSATVELGAVAQATLVASNSGTRELVYSFEAVAHEEHFEGDVFPAHGWTVVNHGSGCAWTRPSRLPNHAGGDGLAAGIDLFDCEQGTPIDTSLVSPVFDLSASHSASLGFFLSLLDGADSWPRLDVEATRDGGASWTALLTRTHSEGADGATAPIEVDLSAFAGDPAVQLRFHYRAAPPWGWIMLDQVHVFHSASEDALIDMQPDHGSLAVGASQQVVVDFDARAIAQPGVYTVPLRVAEDTPYAWAFGDAQARMTVTAPAHYGAVEGVVSGLGRCDLAPTPIEGASVRISHAGGSVTTRTDADGRYAYWFDASKGPLQVEVEAPDHLADAREVALSAGTTTDADFGLRLLAPCLMPDPPALSVVVPVGGSLQQPFDLLNGGPVAGTWSARIGGDPALQTSVPVSQTTSPDPVANMSFGCFNPGTGFSLENRYLRVFPPSDIALPGDVRRVAALAFAIDSAASSSGSQALTLRLHTLDGPLELGNLTLLAEASATITDEPLRRYRAAFDAPIEVPSDRVLVAELYLPDGAAHGTSAYPGGNSEGETAPAYWVAPDCGLPEPVSLPDIAFEWVHLVLELELLASDPCGASASPVEWLAVSPASGSAPGDGLSSLAAALDAGALAAGTRGGSICIGAGTGPDTVMPVTLVVGSGADAVFADGFD
ncbi:MAG: hypothetical protein EOP90_13345 [Lysobacteraceae bacterium]|nr:MAG: hypothetical protein EOP90_13345 [Xanthomonadaceae bacterium]